MRCGLYGGVAVALFILVSCASPPVHVCVRTERYIDLSPREAENQGIRLVRISGSGKVTIRNSRGRLASARVGEDFKWLDKFEDPSGITLKSVDVSSGRVVLMEEEFAM